MEMEYNHRGTWKCTVLTDPRELSFARRRRQTAHVNLSLMSATMSSIYLWNVPSCSVVEGYRYENNLLLS